MRLPVRIRHRLCFSLLVWPLLLVAASGAHAQNVNLYVSLYPDNPDYIEVTVDAERIPANALISDVRFDVSIKTPSGGSQTRQFLFTDRALLPGFYKGWFAHGAPQASAANAGQFSYVVEVGGGKADQFASSTKHKGVAKGGRPGREGQKLATARPPQPQSSPPARRNAFAKPRVHPRYLGESNASAPRLDWCLNWGQDCGKPAADRFCRDMGFSRAAAWRQDTNIGHRTPTYVIGSRRLCSQRFCDGFDYIRCR